MSGLHLERVRLTVSGRTLFDEFTCSIARGEILTVLGPSGSGKSSLLSFICGTLDPTFVACGKITLNGRDIGNLPPEERRVGILFQDSLLFPHLSVGGNLAFALPRKIRAIRERRDLVEAALREAELEEFAHRDPGTLSGGQQARVALMRTLLSDPEALLLDEPFSKLDRDLRARLRAFVFAHVRKRQLPTLLVTHDQEDVCAAGERVLTLQQQNFDR